MASVTASVLIDQSDDLHVAFHRSIGRQMVSLHFLHQRLTVGTLAFSSPEDCAERFALWLESAAQLVRHEAALLEDDEVLNARTELIDAPLNGGPF